MKTSTRNGSAVVSNPFRNMSKLQRRHAVRDGIIKRAYRLGRGDVSRATLSRTFSGVIARPRKRAVNLLRKSMRRARPVPAKAAA